MQASHDDRVKHGAGDRGMSRRRFLGTAGAGAAALTAGAVLGDVQPAAAGYYMKWGAVVSPADASGVDFTRKVNILRRIRPQTARVSMFWGNATTRWFSD
jgi:hypothetical protein